MNLVYVDFDYSTFKKIKRRLKKAPTMKKLGLELLNIFNRDYRFLPEIDKNKIKTAFLLIILFVLVCFYYEWITNIIHHVKLFFGERDDSFLGFIAILFWGIVWFFSGLFFGKIVLEILFKTKNLTTKELEEHLPLAFNNRTGIVILGLFVVFFLFFSSSSRNFNNYIGLKLNTIEEDEYTISGEEYLEYNEREQDVSDEIVYEILYEFDNNLFRKEEEAHIQERLEVFYTYYHVIGFNAEKFIFKETGAFQGYSSHSLKEGFFPYLKCLLISFLETSYRGIVFFSVSGITLFILLLLGSIFTDKQLGSIYQNGIPALVLLLILYFIYPYVLSVIKWISSLFY